MPVLPEQVRIPGIYFDIRSVVRTAPAGIGAGVVMAMIPFPWYEENTPIDIRTREFYDLNYAGKLGFTAFDFNSPYNKKASALTAGAQMAIIFPQYTNGRPATGELDGILFEAGKLGEAGNTLRVNVVQGEDDFSVVTFFGETPRQVDVQQITEWEEFKSTSYVKKPDAATYPPVSAGLISFQDGANGDLPIFSERMGAFLKQASYASSGGTSPDVPEWTVIAFSAELNDPSYAQARAAFRNWLDQLNIDEQRKKRAVIGIAFDDGIDNSNITQIHQEIQLNNEWYTLGESVLHRAGYASGAFPNHNETNDIVRDMTNVRPLKNIRERQNALRRGIFSYIRHWDGRYKIEDDVNSFVSLRIDKNIQWTSNRVIRTIDTFMERVGRKFNTQFKGHVDNTEGGREHFKAEINEICENFVTFSMMQNHNIDKIVISSSGARSWHIEFHNVEIVDSVKDADMIMTVTWGMEVVL